MLSTSTWLGIIGSLLVLCQWFVFQSVRKHLFQKSDEIQRRLAYPVLMGFGLLTILAVRLEFGSEIFAPGTPARQLVSEVVFTYLGWVILLTLFFLFSGTVDLLLKFRNALQSTIITARLGTGSTRPGGSSSCDECEEEQKLQPTENQGQSQPKSGSEEPMRINYQYPTRRTFLKMAAISGLTAATGLGIEGLAEAYGRPAVEKHELFCDSLRGAPRPVTLLHITDCHFGMFFGPDELLNLVELLNSLEADALCVTGDVFHSARTVVEQATPILRRLKTRPLGNLAVLGNHDFYAGETRSVESLNAAGLTVLRNEWVTLRVGGSAIHLGGIDDPRRNWLPGGVFPGFDTCISKAPAEPGMRILLCHRPGVFPLAAKQEIDLTLAGHLHGGQIVIPVPGREKGISAANMVSEYTQGWYKMDDCRMYLNRGVGMTFLPWRIHCPPEIALIRVNPE
jgi:uncharacterized protein